MRGSRKLVVPGRPQCLCQGRNQQPHRSHRQPNRLRQAREEKGQCRQEEEDRLRAPTRGRKPPPNPNEDTPRPDVIVAACGWAEGNSALFKEWESYYHKLVHANDLVTEEDAAMLLGQHRRLIDEQQALHDEQRRVLAFQASLHPVPRPEGAPRENHRHDLLAKTANKQS